MDHSTRQAWRARGSRVRPLPLLGALIAAWLAAQPLSLSAAPAAYEQAIAQARAGHYDQALPVIGQWMRREPRVPAYRYDWIAVSSWAGRHAQALEASSTLKLSPGVPSYVVAAIGKSALETGQSARAVEAYRLLEARQPRSPDAALGLGLALLADGQAVQADAALGRALRLSARKAPELQAAGTALVARGEPTRAEPFAERLRALGATPVFTTGGVAPVEASLVPAVAAVPAPTTDVAPEPGGESGLAERQERNGLHIREAAAVLDADFTPARYALIDAALADNAALVQEAEAAGPTAVLRRLQFDRVVALRLRGHLAQAVAAYTALRDQGVEPPAYVTNAAADAYLALREPERAGAMYRALLAEDPANPALKTALMYAELEAEDLAGAQRLAAEVVADSGGAVGARRTQATLLRFADRLHASAQALRGLAEEFPNDAGLWLDEADLLAARGLPRAAARRYEQVLAADPGNLKARVGLARATWAQGDIPEADRQVAELRRDAPELPAVQRLLKDWARNQRPLFTTSATQGFGQGRVLGNDDLVWESTLYSGQTAQGLRVFANHHLAEARFGGVTASHERVGAGLEWTRRGLQVAAELGQDLRNSRDTSWAAGIGLQLDDHWSLRARHDSQTNDFPLKGRQPGAEAGAPYYLHASKTLVGAAYRVDESRRFAADLSGFGFNDGNRRQALSASWFERLYSGERRTLDVQTALYTSRNSLPDAVYFNPKRDLALSVTVTGDWLTWRRYEKSFNQRLAVTLGSYRQTSDVRQDGQWAERTYGWNAFQDVRYEHEWQWGPDVSARYGIGSRRFPYDGAYETKRYVFLNFNWRF